MKVYYIFALLVNVSMLEAMEVVVIKKFLLEKNDQECRACRCLEEESFSTEKAQYSVVEKFDTNTVCIMENKEAGKYCLPVVTNQHMRVLEELLDNAVIADLVSGFLKQFFELVMVDYVLLGEHRDASLNFCQLIDEQNPMKWHTLKGFLSNLKEELESGTSMAALWEKYTSSGPE